jgi:RNA-directed DNA polymerase
MSDYTANHGLAYTRYADDITLSGVDRTVVNFALDFATACLAKYGLVVKDGKRRVMGAHCQQRVAGIIVNRCGYPPREFRRATRAAFHNAEKFGVVSKEFRNQLRGRLGYLSQFARLRGGADLRRYSAILGNLQVGD